MRKYLSLYVKSAQCVALVFLSMACFGQQSSFPFNGDILSPLEKKLNHKTVDQHANIQPAVFGLEKSYFDVLDTTKKPTLIPKPKFNIGATGSISGGYQLAKATRPVGDGLLGLVFNYENKDKLQINVGYSIYAAAPPQYLSQYADSLRVNPGMGYARKGGSDFYFTHYTYGNITYSPSNHFAFEIGKGKHFWGDGYRSLILSDNAAPFPYARITTKVWKLKYTNLWAQMKDISQGENWKNARKKYAALHALSYNITRKFNLSIYEMVVWQDRDTMSNRTLDINYLNPIIFYRPVEYSIGSPDNVILGMSMRYKVIPRLQLYGQFVLDEFNLKQYRTGNQWWANKVGGQFGAKIFDIIPNLHLQTEANIARPFMYAHGSPVQAWSQQNQPLAHPMGNNFFEWVSFLRYDFKQWKFVEQFTWAAFGRDRDVDGNGSVDNLGGNILRSYKNPYNIYYNDLLQGLRSNFYYHSLGISYALSKYEGLEMFMTHTIRLESTQTENSLDHYLCIGIRNIGMLSPTRDF